MPQGEGDDELTKGRSITARINLRVRETQQLMAQAEELARKRAEYEELPAPKQGEAKEQGENRAAQ